MPEDFEHFISWLERNYPDSTVDLVVNKIKKSGTENNQYYSNYRQEVSAQSWHRELFPNLYTTIKEIAGTPDFESEIANISAGGQDAELDVLLERINQAREQLGLSPISMPAGATAETLNEMVNLWEFSAVEQGMTPYQKEQLELQQQQQAWQVRSDLQAEATAQFDLQQQRAEAARQGMQGGNLFRLQEEARVAAQLSQEFEKFRTELISEYSSARNWVKAWELQNKPNVYADRVADLNSPFVQQQAWQADLETLQSMSPTLIEAGAFSEDQINKDIKAAQDNIKALDKLIEQTIPTQQQTANRPQTPPTPTWLTQFTGQAAGTPIQKTQQAAPPSGQSLTRLAPSQRQGLLGYYDWTGQVAEDVVAQVPQMNTPRTAYQWTPARQR